MHEVREVSASEVRGIKMADFLDSLKKIRRSVNAESLNKFVEWNNQYGDMNVWRFLTCVKETKVRRAMETWTWENCDAGIYRILIFFNAIFITM